jgi:hypothetical protein
MHTAFYYPHMEVSNRNLIKNALLLWDELEYISPFRRSAWPGATRAYNEALRLLATRHVPSQDEKMAAHAIVLELLDSELPDWFFPGLRDLDRARNHKQLVECALRVADCRTLCGHGSVWRLYGDTPVF